MDTELQDLTRVILRALEDKKALDVRVLDLRKVASYTDWLVLCSGTSSVHVRALVGNVKEQAPQRPVYINVSPDDSWWVLDYIDVVVHVFREDLRTYYNLESIWADAKEIHPSAV